MKRNFIKLLAGIAILVATVCSVSAEEIVSNTVPVSTVSTNLLRQLKPFVLKDKNGKEVKYTDAFKGKLLLLFFFTTWAEPCKNQVPALVELQKKYDGTNFSVVGVSLEERTGRELRLFEHRNKVNFPLLFADMLLVQDVGGVTALPTLCLVDQNRMLIMKEAAVLELSTLEEVLKKVRKNQR
jgi:peroxiredoxin